MPFSTIPEALEELRQGRMVVVVDTSGDENEGDLVMAAERVTPEAINFMAVMGRGLVCLALTGERTQQLGLPLMVNPPRNGKGSAFTLSIDAREGVTNGVSAYERAYTIMRAVDPNATADDFVRPGHVFPLRAREGGVLERQGHTEAAVELARLAGLYPAGVTCTVMREDGTLARLPDLVRYALRHSLKLCSIADLAAYVTQHVTPDLARTSETELPTRHGTFRLLTYEDRLTRDVQLALVQGQVTGHSPVLTRIHSECITGEAFGSLCCDCGTQLEEALEAIQAAGAGVLVYLRRHASDEYDSGPVACILRDLGIQQISLLGQAQEEAALTELGIDVARLVPFKAGQHAHHPRYPTVKRNPFGHRLAEGEVFVR